MSRSTALEPIYLPSDLIQSARKKLENEREIELETYISIYLRMLVRAKNVLSLEDNLPFGKYIGEKVDNICRIDPAYMSWLISQDGRTKFKPEVLSLVEEMSEI